jgi:hypothetical protein
VNIAGKSMLKCRAIWGDCGPLLLCLLLTLITQGIAAEASGGTDDGNETVYVGRSRVLAGNGPRTLPVKPDLTTRAAQACFLPRL